MTSRGAKYWNSGAVPLIAPEVLRDIIAQVADVALVISDDGTILSVLVNPLNDDYRRLESFEGRGIRDTLAPESATKLDKRLEVFLTAGPPVRAVELNHSDSVGRWEFPVRYTLHRIGADGAILLLGRDLRAVAEMQQQLVKAQIALERDYEVQREFDTRFRVLMESIEEPIVFLSAENGRIGDLNGAAAGLLGRSREELTDIGFSKEIEGRRKSDVLEALVSQAMAERPAPVSARLVRSGIDVRLHPTLFRAGGERLLLCRIEAGEGAGQTDDLAGRLTALFEQGPDAILFTDESGAILSANDGFLDLIDTAHDVKVKGRALAEFLSRGSVDLRVLLDNAARSGRLRMYPTKLSGDFGTSRSVEIAVTRLQGGAQTVFAFISRDASRADTIRPMGAPVTDDSVRSVMELVGSATLKEIVAETTNVVERMCIETAIELTMNNRVAAAEMLGLSRQSLYVKLRKYGLLARDAEDGE